MNNRRTHIFVQHIELSTVTPQLITATGNYLLCQQAWNKQNIYLVGFKILQLLVLNSVCYFALPRDSHGVLSNCKCSFYSLQLRVGLVLSYFFPVGNWKTLQL